MATIVREQSLAERVAVLEERLARLQRASSVVDDVSIWRVGFENYLFDDASSALSTVHETTFTPRGAALTLGLSFYGDQVGTSPVVNSGGTWDVLLNGVSSASGSVPATYTIIEATPTLDLSPYLGTRDLHVEVRTRRTAGATTGGRYGGGGCIASIVRYARIS
jgi:hypothetical protein